MTENKGLYTADLELNAVEKITAELRSEQADFAVLAERHIEAIKALGNIRKMIAGMPTTSDLEIMSHVWTGTLFEIDEQCVMILEAGDERV